MYKYLFLIVVIFPSCFIQERDEMPKSDFWQPMDSAMNAQVKAWNEGDVDGFMQAYWKSDSLLFIGKNGVKRGWQTTLNNYKKSYPNKQSMGVLRFTAVERKILNENNAFMIGKWELFREMDTLSGHYTLLWKRLNGQWKIIADHSS